MNMRQRLIAVTVLLLLAMAAPGRAADLACGSDTSDDPIVAMGKDIWLNGFCEGFGDCANVLKIFHSCQAAERFFSNLEPRRDSAPTQSQVADALVQYTGKTQGLSSCSPWSFDAEACKRYLGLGGASDEPAPEAPASHATTEVSSARKPMSFSEALVARRRVIDADTKAHSAVGASGTTCRAGADECRRMLESMVDPVIQEADELNANPEYLAQLPAYALVSVRFVSGMGWTRQDDLWIFGAGNGASASGQNTGTLGNYLLSVEECRKLRDTLDQEIKVDPGKEPDNLSFFEGECVPQLASFADDLKRWRGLLTATAKTEKSAGDGGVAGIGTQADSADDPAGGSDASASLGGQTAGDEASSIASLDDWASASEMPARPADKPWYSWWRKFKTGSGCAFFLFGGTPTSGSGLIPDEDVDPADNKFSVGWSGECVDGYAEGPGRITFSGEVDENGGTGRYMVTEVAVGTMKNGVFDGFVEWDPTEEHDYPAKIYARGCVVSETPAYRNAELCKANPADKWYCQSAWKSEPTYRTEGCSAFR